MCVHAVVTCALDSRTIFYQLRLKQFVVFEADFVLLCFAKYHAVSHSYWKPF
jgi:hypothetical protein